MSNRTTDTKTGTKTGTSSGTTITVTQVKSGIGAKPKTRGTLRALGLGRIGKSNTLPDRPEIRGMIARVPHLVDVTVDRTADVKADVKAESEEDSKEDR
jgi:large subunit ribosomal protein L30